MGFLVLFIVFLVFIVTFSHYSLAIIIEISLILVFVFTIITSSALYSSGYIYTIVMTLKAPAILTIWARDLFLYNRQYDSLMNTSSQSSHRGFHQIINGRDMR